MDTGIHSGIPQDVRFVPKAIISKAYDFMLLLKTMQN